MPAEQRRSDQIRWFSALAQDDVAASSLLAPAALTADALSGPRVDSLAFSFCETGTTTRAPLAQSDAIEGVRAPSRGGAAAGTPLTAPTTRQQIITLKNAAPRRTQQVYSQSGPFSCGGWRPSPSLHPVRLLGSVPAFVLVPGHSIDSLLSRCRRQVTADASQSIQRVHSPSPEMVACCGIPRRCYHSFNSLLGPVCTTLRKLRPRLPSRAPVLIISAMRYGFVVYRKMQLFHIPVPRFVSSRESRLKPRPNFDIVNGYLLKNTE